MLKTRIIPTLLCRGRELVKGRNFHSVRRVGNTLQSARVHNMRGVDELCILSVDGLLPPKSVEDLCDGCFMPVSIGGGIRDMESIEMLFENGADKVVLNTGAVRTPELITEAAAKWGRQSIVVSIDVLDEKVCVSSGRDKTELDPTRWAHKCQTLGAGEILLNNVDYDGKMEGYDCDLIARVSLALRIPVVAAGGCGTYGDMVSVLKDTQAHAVSASAMFLFTDSTPKGAAKYLRKAGFEVRVE